MAADTITVRGLQYRVVVRCVGGVGYRLAVAHSWRQRMRGLAGTSLATWSNIDGMLFIFPFAWRWPLWMRGMQFPITLQWLRADVPIGSLHQMTPAHPWHCDRPLHPADAVIEYLPGHFV
ncbi:MAG: DUF192 domain-containing protein [Deltaproteobacteria bacterium]|nr:DUF192 domain-containing protein [Deltaproteobacteria bacterium]